MRVKTIVLTTEELVKALGLPRETAVIDVERDKQTLDIEVTIQSQFCPEKEDHAQKLRERFEN